MFDFGKLSGLSIVEKELLERLVGTVSCIATLSRALEEESLTGSLRLAYLAIGDSGGFASTNSVCKWTNTSIEHTEDVLGKLVERGLLKRATSEAANFWIAWSMFNDADLERPAHGPSQWMPSLDKRRRILQRDDYTCTYCGAKDSLSLDHVVPRIRGGGHDDTNLVTCCRSCNTSKGAKTVAEFIEWRRQKGLLAS